MISIIVPTRDRLKLLQACLHSVQAQTFGDWECLVVDDHSIDATPETLTRLGQEDGRYKFFALTDKSGASAARNLGLERALGNFVLFLDSDDALHPECLEARFEAMQAHPELDFGVFPTLLFCERPGDCGLRWNVETDEDDLDRYLFLDIPWQTSGVLWWRESLLKLGPWLEGLPSWQDWEFHTRALCRGLTYQRFPDGVSYWRRPRADSLWSQSHGEAHLRSHVTTMDGLVDQLKAKGPLPAHRKCLLAGLYFWHARLWYGKHRRRTTAIGIWAQAWRHDLISLGRFLEGLRWFSRLTRGPNDDLETVFPLWPTEFRTGSSRTFQKMAQSRADLPGIGQRFGIFIDEWRDGGVPVFVERLERFLTEAGCEVFLFLAHPHPKRDEVSKKLYLDLKARLGRRCVTLDHKSRPLAWRRNHLRNVILSRGISSLLLNHFSFFVDDLAAIANEVALISVAHTDLDYYYSEYLQSMRFTRAHVVVSERIQEKTLLISAPSRADKIHRIPYGIEESGEIFQPEINGPLRVVYCARLDFSQKRCQDLVPIWKGFMAEGNIGTLTILGVGRGLNFLEAEFAGEIKNGTVQLLGQVSAQAVLKEMARSDVLLNISNYEGLPQVVLEGASLGLHPLLTDIESGHREIVARLGYGTLCHVGDTPAFTRELIRLQSELAVIRKQRRSLREATLASYSLGDSCRRYRELMEQAGTKATADFQIIPQHKTLRERVKRLTLLAKYRRHFSR